MNDTCYTECWLTTFDNPFDPFDKFEDWFRFDIDHGYYTCAVVDRIAHLTDDLSEVEKDHKTEQAIDRIISLDVFNMYKKVKKVHELQEKTEKSHIN